MKKIACCGYHATGAGVIDDLFREFDNVVQGAYECESRFLHDADGISDLEYNIVENPHRLNSSFAVKRFLAYAKRNNRQLSKVYGDAWLKYVKEYAQSIIKFEYEGYKGWEVSMYSPLDRYLEMIKRGLNKLRPKSIRHQAWYNYYPGKKTIHACLDENTFLSKTHEFVDKLANSMLRFNTDEFVLMDQLIPGNNIDRYLRYVKDVKVIVVDRDPRDLYIRQRVLKDHVLPNDPHQFCEYYRDIRPRKNAIIPDNVIYIFFEDMIYHYDEMVEKILLFLGIDKSHHIAPKTHFDPSKSIKGTRMWEVYPEYTADVAIIKNELSDYLYKY